MLAFLMAAIGFIAFLGAAAAYIFRDGLESFLYAMISIAFFVGAVVFWIAEAPR